MKPKVSIIIPVYNVEEYVDECLASVAAQSLTDWEGVIVNDGSTDGSSSVCRQWIAKDSRFRMMENPSPTGLSAARNQGLDSCRGEYVFFLDSDDMLSPDALEKLLQIAERESSDMVCARFSRNRIDFDKECSARKENGKFSAGVAVDSDEAVMQILYQDGITSSACAKLFSMRLWDGFRFREGILYEDLDIMPETALRAGKIVDTKEVVYYYRQRGGSIVHEFSERRLEVLDVIARLESVLPKRFAKAIRERMTSAAFNMYMLLAVNGRSGSEEATRCWEIIRSNRKGVLADRRSRLKSRLGSLLALTGGKSALRLMAGFLYR